MHHKVDAADILVLEEVHPHLLGMVVVVVPDSVQIQVM
jgi:hypothetical protein